MSLIPESAGITGLLPIDTVGLKLWLRARDISGLANGASVSSWIDVSGLANSPTQGTGAKQPSYQTSQANGQPIVRFVDGARVLVCPTLVTVSQSYTIMVALKLTTLDTNGTIFFNGSRTGPSNGYGINADFQGNGFGDRAINHQGAGTARDLVNETSNFEVWTATNDGSQPNSVTEPKLYLNGTQESINDIGGVIAPTGGTFIGGLDSTPTNGAFMDLAELIFWDVVKTAAQRQQAQRYLGAIYGITVA